MADREPARHCEQLLSDAVRVMTEAARIICSRADGDGRSVAGRTDWAEFVTLALAGAAANAGGIENVLAGRPGSWEADHVRQLLISTVGHDEQQLPEHRTEPVVVDVFVDEIMVDLGMWRAYDNAQQELTRRYADLTSATMAEQAHEPRALAVAREQQLDELAALEERLEAQRLLDWAEYGQALKTGIEAAARRRQGLRVPVVVNLDIETFRAEGGDRSSGLEGQLLQEALMSTPLPGDTVPLQDRPDPRVLDRLSPLSRPTASAPAPAARAPDLQ